MTSLFEPRLQQLLSSIEELGRQRSLTLYIVGGWVRDLLLERRLETTDVDIVLEGDAIEFATAVAQQFSGSLQTHATFKTAKLTLDNRSIDFVTARKETYIAPGKLPSVTPSSMKDDLLRRDFTINAMALPLASVLQNCVTSDAVLDPTGGAADLSSKLIRILHDLSFVDDPTRMFRALRYARRLKFALEARTERLLKEAVKGNAVGAISLQRVWNELRKVCSEPTWQDILSDVMTYRLLPSPLRPDDAQLLILRQRVAKAAALSDIAFNRAELFERLLFFSLPQESRGEAFLKSGFSKRTLKSFELDAAGLLTAAARDDATLQAFIRVCES